MTTTATDGITIAADGMVSGDGVIYRRDWKKILVEDGAIYAFIGSAAMQRPIIDWVKGGAHPVDMPKPCSAEMTWTLLVIDVEHGLRRYTSTAPYVDPEVYPCTEGSGHTWAMGALRAGASPVAAVRIACEFDMASGGEIQVVNIAEALGRQPPALEADRVLRKRA